MNRMTRFASALTLVLAATSLPAAAGNGSGTGGGPLTDIYAGDCYYGVEGTVATINTAGGGYEIDTADGLLSLFGMGPARYWDSLGVALPEVGENLAVDLCVVEFSDGSSKAIATIVYLGDTTVVLRDEETGQPLWRAAGAGTQAAAGGGGQVQAGVGKTR